MNVIKLITIAVVFAVLVPCCRPQCNGKTHGTRDDVLEIRPTDGLGSLLDKDYYVKEFVDLQSKVNRASWFGVDPKYPDPRYPLIAKNVPYGRYRIVLQSKSGSDVFGRVFDYCGKYGKYETVEVPNHFARVHIVLLNETLNSVEADDPRRINVTQFSDIHDGTEMASLFKGAVADHVPYGHYDLSFLANLGGADRHVDVLQPDVWVFSGSILFPYGAFPASLGPQNIVRGELRNIPANERPVFPTMSGVNIPYTINSAVTDTGGGNGTFSFVGGNPPDVFMLYTIGKSGILDAREFKTPRDSEIIIDLAHPNPPKIEVP